MDYILGTKEKLIEIYNVYVYIYKSLNNIYIKVGQFSL